MAETNPAGGAAPLQTQVVLTGRDAPSAYANFARVTATPEELVLDFALDLAPMDAGPHEAPVSQRLVLNFFTAKRLWQALGVALRQHEEAFGPLEVDPRRRAGPTAGGPAGRAGS
jgi:hypothetical protein